MSLDLKKGDLIEILQGIAKGKIGKIKKIGDYNVIIEFIHPNIGRRNIRYRHLWIDAKGKTWRRADNPSLRNL